MSRGSCSIIRSCRILSLGIRISFSRGTISCPSFHHGIQSRCRLGSPNTLTQRSHGSHGSKHAPSPWTKAPTTTSGSSILLILILLVLFLLLLLIGSFLQDLHPLEESLREGVSWVSNLHHIVLECCTWILASCMTRFTQVIVITDNTLVPISNDRVHLTSITGNSIVNSLFRFSLTSNSFIDWSIALFSLLDNHIDLVEGSWHLSQCNDKLLIISNGDIVSTLISPANGKVQILQLGKNCLKFFNQVVMTGTDIFVNDKSSHLFFLIFQIDFKRDCVCHFCFLC